MSDSVSTVTRLRYAAGYLALKLQAEARAELEAIAPADHDTLPVISLHAHCCSEAEDWAGAAALGERLTGLDPGDAGHWIQWAYAVRRLSGIPAARAILLTALGLHPQESIIHFNLACYEAQLGNLPAAKSHLRNACSLHADCREMALADTDLVPLHPWIAAGLPLD
jgi:tetratricopeptide (TPR) repeat protein